MISINGYIEYIYHQLPPYTLHSHFVYISIDQMSAYFRQISPDLLPVRDRTQDDSNITEMSTEGESGDKKGG